MGERGTGHVFQPTYTDPRTGELRKAKTWAYRASLRGKRFGKAGFGTKTLARKACNVRLQEMARGQDAGQAERVTMDDLEARIRAHYGAFHPKTAPSAILTFRRLRRVYDWPRRAVDITVEELERYVAKRKGETTPATINLELQYLLRALRLCLAKHGVTIPTVPRLHHRPGWGTVRPDEMERLLAVAPAWWRAALHVNVIVGWRLRSELLTRTWPDVDFVNGWVRLPDSKNGDPRRFPLIPQVRAILEAQRLYVSGLEAQAGQIIPWVFCLPNGRQLRDPRKIWRTACRAAGIEGRKPHHLRYTALQEFDAAGLARSVAQAFSGQRTGAIFDDYARPAERHLKAAGEQLSQHLGPDPFRQGKVVGFRPPPKKKQRAQKRA